MIQRIQTIWLALTAILSAFLCGEYIIKFTGKDGVDLFLGFSGIFRNTGSIEESLGNSLPLSVALVLISVLSLVALFLYKQRGLQKALTLIIIICSVLLPGLLILYSLKVIRNYDALPVFGLRAVLPLLILILSLLAYRGVKKDDKLLKSYDRLR